LKIQQAFGTLLVHLNLLNVNFVVEASAEYFLFFLFNSVLAFVEK